MAAKWLQKGGNRPELQSQSRSNPNLVDPRAVLGSVWLGLSGPSLVWSDNVDRSDPASPNHGQWLSVVEVTMERLLGAVRQWGRPSD